MKNLEHNQDDPLERVASVSTYEPRYYFRTEFRRAVNRVADVLGKLVVQENAHQIIQIATDNERQADIAKTNKARFVPSTQLNISTQTTHCMNCEMSGKSENKLLPPSKKLQIEYNCKVYNNATFCTSCTLSPINTDTNASNIGSNIGIETIGELTELDMLLKQFDERDQKLLSKCVYLTESETMLFEFGMLMCEKEFGDIQILWLPTKDTGTLVQFYYIWKKLPSTAYRCKQSGTKLPFFTPDGFAKIKRIICDQWDIADTYDIRSDHDLFVLVKTYMETTRTHNKHNKKATYPNSTTTTTSIYRSTFSAYINTIKSELDDVCYTLSEGSSPIESHFSITSTTKRPITTRLAAYSERLALIAQTIFMQKDTLSGNLLTLFRTLSAVNNLKVPPLLFNKIYGWIQLQLLDHFEGQVNKRAYKYNIIRQSKLGFIDNTTFAPGSLVSTFHERYASPLFMHSTTNNNIRHEEVHIFNK